MNISTFSLLVLLLCAGSAATTQAQDKSVVAAANAFAKAQQAELSGDHDRAAELFELADRIAPTPEALRSATRARRSAGQLAPAAGHAEELLRRYPADKAARELAEQVLTSTRSTHTRYELQCTQPCTVAVDGLAASVAPLQTQQVYVTPGVHELSVGFEGGAAQGLRLQGRAGEARTIQVAPPPRKLAATSKQSSDAERAASGADATVRSSQRRGLHPVYLWTAASLTVATGAIALWSGLDLLRARDEFEASVQPTRAEFEAGEKKDRRTNILLGATGAMLIGTASLALVTRFRADEPRQRAGFSVSRDGAQLSWVSRF